MLVGFHKLNERPNEYASERECVRRVYAKKLNERMKNNTVALTSISGCKEEVKSGRLATSDQDFCFYEQKKSYNIIGVTRVKEQHLGGGIRPNESLL